MDERDNHFERCTDLGVTMIWQQPLDVGRRATLCAQFFFYHISHFRCHFILSFQGNFCFYKYVSFTLQHCQQWNVTKIADESSTLILTWSVGDNEAWQGPSFILHGKNVAQRTKHAQWNLKRHQHLNASRPLKIVVVYARLAPKTTNSIHFCSNFMNCIYQIKSSFF